MKAKRLVLIALFGVVAAGTVFGVNAALQGDDSDVLGDATAASIGIPAPTTGGELPTVSDMMIDGEYDGLLPDEVLFIDGEERHDGPIRDPQELEEVNDPNGVEVSGSVSSGMMVPGFDGDVADMVVETN